MDKDINEEKFDGKKVYKVSTAKAINDVDNVIKESFNASIFSYKNLNSVQDKSSMYKSNFYKYLMSGVSPITPIVSSGGILIAIGIYLAGIGSDGPNLVSILFIRQLQILGLCLLI